MQHLAIIPDGNRRWAKQNKLESFFGHQRGMEVVRYAIQACIKNSVKYLSFYTFSTENFRRSDIEKNYLFNLLVDGFTKNLPELISNGVRVCFIGDRALFPEKVRVAADHIEDQTKHLDKLQLNLLFCYGATAEITHAVKALAHKVKMGLLQPEEIDETKVHDELWTAAMPDPDLIIRTGGVVRLSNFMLYQSAYAEFSFLDCFWPEVTEDLLERSIQKFDAVKRNFGQ